MGFEIEQRYYPSTRTTVVRPVGELSIPAMNTFRSALRRAVREDAAIIVVDLRLTSVTESALVFSLVEAARLGRAFGSAVVVATPPTALLARLATCGLSDRRHSAVEAPTPLGSRTPDNRRSG